MSNLTTHPKLRGAGRMAWDIFLWVIGTLLYAVSVVIFVRPLQISSGGLTGLGYALTKSREFLWSDQLIALMIVIAVLGVIFDQVVVRIEKRTLRWK